MRSDGDLHLNEMRTKLKFFLGNNGKKGWVQQATSPSHSAHCQLWPFFLSLSSIQFPKKFETRFFWLVSMSTRGFFFFDVHLCRQLMLTVTYRQRHSPKGIRLQSLPTNWVKFAKLFQNLVLPNFIHSKTHGATVFIHFPLVDKNLQIAPSTVESSIQDCSQLGEHAQLPHVYLSIPTHSRQVNMHTC